MEPLGSMVCLISILGGMTVCPLNVCPLKCSRNVLAQIGPLTYRQAEPLPQRECAGCSKDAPWQYCCVITFLAGPHAHCYEHSRKITMLQWHARLDLGLCKKIFCSLSSKDAQMPCGMVVAYCVLRPLSYSCSWSSYKFAA